MRSKIVEAFSGNSQKVVNYGLSVINTCFNKISVDRYIL